ncbi:MAG: hypothetical protein ACOC8E_04585 [Planctomycetota bacterium]
MSEGSGVFPIFIRPLNRLGLAYMVTGSAASMAYGTPRLTLDIDLVLGLSAEQADLVPKAFPPDTFYCPPMEVIAIEAERPTRGHFNVIHSASGFKADIYPVGEDPLHGWGMARRRTKEIWGETVVFAPPEYVIVRKLEFFREGGSKKHREDIRAMLDVSGDLIDLAELETLIGERGLSDVWREIRESDG